MKPIKYKKNMKLKTGEIYQTSDGFYRYINNNLYTGIAKIDDIEIDYELDETLEKIKLPKIPSKIFNKIKYFFQEVYKKHRSEVAILLWYNFGEKEWLIEVPKQSVSGASVKYERDEEKINENTKSGFTCVGSIHSHCEMSAFHSGVDDADEYNFDGLHITIGKVISNPEYACRFIIKNQEYELEKEHCIELIDDKIFEINDWMENVNKKEYKINQQYLTGYNFSKGTCKDIIKCPICQSKVLSSKIMCSECGCRFDEDHNEYLDYITQASQNKEVISEEGYNKFKYLN